MVRDIRVLRRRDGSLAVLLLPLATGLFLAFGFWDFLLATVGLLLVVGYWLRHHADESGVRFAVLSGLLVLTALLHPSGLLPAVPFVLLVVFLDRSEHRGRRPFAILTATAVACIPALVPAVLVSRNAEGTSPRPPLTESLQGLFSLTYVVRVLHDNVERAVTILFVALIAALFVAAFVARRRAVRPEVADALLVVAVASGVGALVVPNAIGGAELLNQRLAFYAVMFLVLWASCQPVAFLMRSVVAIAGAVVAIALVGARLPAQRDIGKVLDEYVSVAQSMDTGSTYVIALSHDTRAIDTLRKSFRVDPLAHAGGYLAVEHELVELDNYEGRYHYFPYQYVAARDPLRELFHVTDPRVRDLHPTLDLAGTRAGPMVGSTTWSRSVRPTPCSSASSAATSASRRRGRAV